MLAVGLSYIAFVILRNAPSIPTLLNVFYHKWVLYFIKYVFCFDWYDQVILVFPFFYVMYYIYWFVNIVPSLHHWAESPLIKVYDLLNVLLDAVCQYFVEDFNFYVHQQCWPVIFFLCCVFTWFWNQDDAGFIQRVWESSVFLDFLE